MGYRSPFVDTRDLAYEQRSAEIDLHQCGTKYRNRLARGGDKPPEKTTLESGFVFGYLSLNAFADQTN